MTHSLFFSFFFFYRKQPGTTAVLWITQTGKKHWKAIFLVQKWDLFLSLTRSEHAKNSNVTITWQTLSRFHFSSSNGVFVFITNTHISSCRLRQLWISVCLLFGDQQHPWIQDWLRPPMDTLGTANMRTAAKQSAKTKTSTERDPRLHPSIKIIFIKKKNTCPYEVTFPQTIGNSGWGKCAAVLWWPKWAGYVTASSGCSLEWLPFPFLMTA